MKTMWRLLKRWGVFVYLGGAMGAMGYWVFMWQWWVVTLPIIVLIALRLDSYLKEARP